MQQLKHMINILFRNAMKTFWHYTWLNLICAVYWKKNQCQLLRKIPWAKNSFHIIILCKCIFSHTPFLPGALLIKFNLTCLLRNLNVNCRGNFIILCCLLKVFIKCISNLMTFPPTALKSSLFSLIQVGWSFASV